MYYQITRQSHTQLHILALQNNNCTDQHVIIAGFTQKDKLTHIGMD